MPSSKKPKVLDFLARTEIGESVVHALSLGGEATRTILVAIAAGTVREATAYERGNAVFVLGELEHAKAATPLIKLAHGKDLRLRLLALRALGKIGGPAARKALINVAANTKATVSDRSYAVEALGAAGEKSDAEALKRIKTRPEDRLLMDKIAVASQRLAQN